MLASQNQQKALDKFVKGFREKWKAKTDCRKGYVTQDCKNAPKPTPTPTPGRSAARAGADRAAARAAGAGDAAGAVAGRTGG